MQVNVSRLPCNLHLLRQNTQIHAVTYIQHIKAIPQPVAALIEKKNRFVNCHLGLLPSTVFNTVKRFSDSAEVSVHKGQEQKPLLKCS